ncbi:MAG: hypothetical protein FWD52_08005 [Candidatus Bathyarchaeota archaeon]|nr:hypothetical protein [Candidatus Termiticorpusculum sp.]
MSETQNVNLQPYVEEELSEQQKTDITTLLKTIFNNVDWKKFGNGFDSYKFYAQRVEAFASSKPSVAQFFNKLCFDLDVQGTFVNVNLIDSLDKKGSVVLKFLRNQPTYFILRFRCGEF